MNIQSLSFPQKQKFIMFAASLRRFFLLLLLLGVFPLIAFSELEITVAGEKPGEKLEDGQIVSLSIADRTDKYALYKIVYMSDGLRITGRLSVPEGAAGTRYPAIVFNHGGVEGIPQPMLQRCGELSEMGYVVLAPSYRGEDGSEGEIEVAAGEVNDVLNAVRVLRSLPYVDPYNIGMVGASHGALITLLAATRSADIKAAVAAYGVTNVVSWYRYLVEHKFDVSDPLSMKVYGEGPEDRPDDFRIRSPVLFAEKITAPLLLLYGEKDTTVPTSQGREMEAKLRAYKKDFEFKVIPSVGHGFLFFLNPEKHTAEEMKESAAAWQYVIQFLDNHLKSKDKKDETKEKNEKRNGY